jgi:hypothetical protein
MCSDIAPAPPARSLRDHVRALLDGLAAGEPGAVARMRAVVGSRRAAITVDDETVLVAFRGGQPQVEAIDGAAPHDAVAGTGVTDRQTVLALLNGDLEVSEAIERGTLEIIGTLDDVIRMGAAIEILIDGAVRVPALQRLARDYRDDPDKGPYAPVRPPGRSDRARQRDREHDILSRLGLLSDGNGGRP